MYHLRVPQTEEELDAYYHFRWEMLRKPLHQPKGSERDAWDAMAHHQMVVDEEGNLVAVGRLYINADNEASIRFMAVHPSVQDKGLGTLMAMTLESVARQEGVKRVTCSAREDAVEFFAKLGFVNQGEITAPQTTPIRHFLMIKPIATLDDIRPQLWARINAFTKPLIAAVNGFALGAGCELALLCDVVIAGDNARFGLPEITLGIMPGAGGTQRLIRSVGKSLASKMVLTGESITAAQALSAGLVSDVYPASLTLEYALKQAALMARHSPLALQAAKQALRQSQEVPLQAGLAQERQLFALLAATDDRREGINAFLQKRTPDFKGR